MLSLVRVARILYSRSGNLKMQFLIHVYVDSFPICGCGLLGMNLFWRLARGNEKASEKREYK